MVHHKKHFSFISIPSYLHCTEKHLNSWKENKLKDNKNKTTILVKKDPNILDTGDPVQE